VQAVLLLQLLLRRCTVHGAARCLGPEQHVCRGDLAEAAVADARGAARAAVAACGRAGDRRAVEVDLGAAAAASAAQRWAVGAGRATARLRALVVGNVRGITGLIGSEPARLRSPVSGRGDTKSGATCSRPLNSHRLEQRHRVASPRTSASAGGHARWELEEWRSGGVR